MLTGLVLLPGNEAARALVQLDWLARRAAELRAARTMVHLQATVKLEARSGDS